ncbi:MAG: hypothetical protein FWD40_03865 [Treponema sp.]|nr:hypothetical protein [Treponema sp.]
MKKIAIILTLCLVIVSLIACNSAPPAAAEQAAEQVAERTGQAAQQAVSQQTAAQQDNDKNDLWILAVGVNQYQNNQYYPNLSFAVSDAKNIIGAFQSQRGNAYNNVNTLLIADSADKRPTRDNIYSGMDFLMDAQPNDTVIVFIASHRIIQDGVYYIMPSDSRYVRDSFDPASMIPFDDILKMMLPSKALVILDTHAPESAIEIANEKNIAILGACAVNEQARESHDYAGGLLTISIMEAFSSVVNSENQITLGDLYTYVRNRVNFMSGNAQNPFLHAPSHSIHTVIGLRQ